MSYILKKGGGSMNVHVDIDRWLRKCPCLSTWGRWVVKNGQNLVHVVFEWPLVAYEIHANLKMQFTEIKIFKHFSPIPIVTFLGKNLGKFLKIFLD